MARASGNGKRVLVVEDEPAIGKVCLRTLHTDGFEVDVAVDGKLARDMLDRNTYDLCLIDIRMPQMNGVELYQQLKDNYPELINRVIFTTGDVISDNIRTFLEQTGTPVLPKPFTPDDLRSIVGVSLEALS